MERLFPSIQSKKKKCSCNCHLQSSLCYYMNCCCCPFLCYNHESTPNVISNSYRALESPRFIVPHKEKELYIKSEARDKIPLLRNRNIDIYPRHSNTEVMNNDLDINNNNIISKNNLHKNSKVKNDKKRIILFKKIKVNKNNKERIFTIPSSTTSRHKKIIGINNFYPDSLQRNNKSKQINNYDLNKNKKIFVNKKLNLTNINGNNNSNQNSSFGLNSSIRNKFKFGDNTDDIINIKQNIYSSETNDNRKILQNLKIEIDKAKNMINNLKSENKKLKNKLNHKEKNSKIENKIDNEKNYLNIDNDNIEKDLEKDVLYLKQEIKEISYKLKEYENFIDLLKKKNNEQETIIANKDKEILDLIIKIGTYEKLLKNNEPKQEQLNISYDNYKNANDNLKKEIFKLKQLEENNNNKIKELEIKLKFEQNFNNKKQKILESLFNFYQNLKKVINYEKSKVLLKDVIDIITVDDFQNKLNKFENKIIQIIEDIQIKYGHCFACDIACCTSHVDKLRAFRKKVPKKK